MIQEKNCKNCKNKNCYIVTLPEEKKKDGYDTGHFDSNGDWVEGACKMCCWYYDSKFEVK